MIPLRIMLKGFLCYRDEQEVLLDGSSLWMLAGLNGSGKSAVFDAMTFALFGCHRGGSIQLAELINHDSNNLAVEFDFALDRQTYRIRRTLARTARGSPRSTHQISRLKTPIAPDPATDVAGSPAPGLTAEPEPEPLEDTNTANGFKQWVREHIGLSYETFTSSVTGARPSSWCASASTRALISLRRLSARSCSRW